MTGHIDNLEILVDAQLPTDGEFVAAAGWWLTEVGRVLGGPVWDQMAATASTVRLGRDGFPHGEPGGVAGTVSVLPKPPWTGDADSVTIRPHSAGNHEWIHGELMRRPLASEFELEELDDAGDPYEVGGGALRVSVTVLEDSPDWVQFAARMTRFRTGENLSQPQVAARWAGVCRELSMHLNPSFAHVCDGYVGDGQTPLDTAVFRGGRIPSIIGGRQVLRGYSWVTVVPSELAAKVGGVRALLASGAFVVVEELPSGGLWLRATETPADYDGDAVRRVFEALAPVLPPGQPQRDPFVDPHRRLVWEDAATWR